MVDLEVLEDVQVRAPGPEAEADLEVGTVGEEQVSRLPDGDGGHVCEYLGVRKERKCLSRA